MLSFFKLIKYGLKRKATQRERLNSTGAHHVSALFNNAVTLSAKTLTPIRCVISTAEYETVGGKEKKRYFESSVLF